MERENRARVVGGQMVSINQDGLQFCIDGKPKSWKRPGIRYHSGGRARVYNPCKAGQRAWIAVVKGLLQSENRQGYAFNQNVELEVDILFQFERSTGGKITSQACADLDNLSKFVLDALQGPDGLVPNDAQISRLVSEKRFGDAAFTMVSLRKRLIDLTLDGFEDGTDESNASGSMDEI